MRTVFSLVGRSALAAVVVAAGLVAAPVDAAGAAPSAGYTDPAKMDGAFIELWNAQRFDEIRAMFADDVVYAFPNHEPFRGPDAILAFFKQLRPLVGDFAPGVEVYTAARKADLYVQMVSYTTKDGVRINESESMARQPDGTWKYILGQTGLRDPLR